MKLQPSFHKLTNKQSSHRKQPSDRASFFSWTGKPFLDVKISIAKTHFDGFRCGVIALMNAKADFMSRAINYLQLSAVFILHNNNLYRLQTHVIFRTLNR
jgi:hypothetical protein